MVYNWWGLDGLLVTNVSTQATRTITDFGAGPDWSPSGELIVFSYGPYAGTRYMQLLTSIWTVRPDGSDLNQIIETTCQDRGGGSATKCVEGAGWSPDSAQIVYTQRDFYHRYADVYRMQANGHQTKNLTGDVDEDAYPVAWVGGAP